MTQVITRDGRDFTPFVAINRRLGRLDIARGTGLNLYKTKNFLLPGNQVNFTLAARRAKVAIDDNVAQLSEVEIGHFFATLANVLVRGALVGR
jgi:hypothetical protein